MKKRILFLSIISILILSSLSCFAQLDTFRWEASKLAEINNVYSDGYHIFSQNQSKIEEGEYKKNCKIETWKYYDEKGELESEVNYVCNANGRSDYNGSYTEYYPSSKVKLKGFYSYAENSIPCINCFDNGFRKNEKIEWAQLGVSLKVGEWKEYYENGQLKSNGAYFYGVHQTFNIECIVAFDVNGAEIPVNVATIGTEHLKHGTWKYYSKEGTLVSTTFYWQGLVVGEHCEK